MTATAIEQTLKSKTLIGLRAPFGWCRLCWRIAISIFAAILLVEATVLVFATARFETDKLAEIEARGMAWITTIIRVHQNVMDVGAIENASHELPQLSKILGLTLYSPTGAKIGSFGAAPSLTLAPLGRDHTDAKSVRSDDGKHYQVIRYADKLKAPFIAAVRLDASSVADDVRAFLWRSLTDILILTLVVTLATLAVLSALVFVPIVRLRRHLDAAGRNPEQTEAYTIDTDQNDEMGEVTRAFNSMVRRLTHSIQSIRAHEKELEFAKYAAESANRAKSDFLSSMSHELRTPLNAIIGFSQLLELNPQEPLSNKQREHTGHVITSGEHLLGLINQVLELSKIETGIIDVSLEDVGPGDVISGSLDIVHVLAEENDVQIDNRAAGQSLPLLRTDRSRLLQILLNLLSNAIKYNRTGGRGTLEAEEVKNGFLRIRITDTGPGIPKSKHAGLFEPFNRLGREAGEIEGTGIGLTITKQIIELLGGEIGIESEAGAGASFWIDLPISRNN